MRYLFALNIFMFSLLFNPVISFAKPALDGKQIYEQYCAACHDVGTAMAPRLSDTDFWKKLLKKAKSTGVLTHVVKIGKGSMPPKGGCSVCSDDDLRKAVEYMLPKELKVKVKITELPLNLLKLPKGFSIQLYADNVAGARQMALGEDGIVYVGTRGQGKVYALLPNASKTQVKEVVTIAEGLNEPNGVAYHNGSLFVSEIHRIIRFDQITQHIRKLAKPLVVSNKLPSKRWHGYRYIGFSPKKELYVAIGMPCNTCNYRKMNPLFGTIIKMKPDGSDMQIYAKGIRNSVGFDWQPNTENLWFTDNGQDMMGDDLPPDEVNQASKQGMDFGFPYFYGDNILSPGYQRSKISSKNMTPPAFELGAHVAPLGLKFYRGKTFPKEYQQQIFVTEHGSWNRSKKVGYRIIWLEIKNGKVIKSHPFITGWLQGEASWGRPVDLLNLPDGSLLISDDQAGAVYRVIFQNGYF